MDTNKMFTKTGALVLFATIIITAAAVLPFDRISWGRISMTPVSSITVMGEATSKQKSQIATINAGISSIKDNKDAAITEVNQKMTAIIEATKKFGVKEEDIKTQSINIYQQEESYYVDGSQKQRAGQWRVSNSIDITLREVEKASALTEVVSTAGANSIYGPNFALDETGDIEKNLLNDAVADAKKKAEIIAKGNKQTVGKILSITEGSTLPIRPMIYDAAGKGGGGGDMMPGTQTVQNSVTVTFELR